MKTFIGEQWTDGELSDASHIFSAVCEGVDALISHERMTHLAERGLVDNIQKDPLRRNKAAGFTFMHTEKLVRLVTALRAVKG